jgi:hypothetical protein
VVVAGIFGGRPKAGDFVGYYDLPEPPQDPRESMARARTHLEYVRQRKRAAGINA